MAERMAAEQHVEHNSEDVRGRVQNPRDAPISGGLSSNAAAGHLSLLSVRAPPWPPHFASGSLSEPLRPPAIGGGPHVLFQQTVHVPVPLGRHPHHPPPPCACRGRSWQGLTVSHLLTADTRKLPGHSGAPSANVAERNCNDYVNECVHRGTSTRPARRLSPPQLGGEQLETKVFHALTRTQSRRFF